MTARDSFGRAFRSVRWRIVSLLVGFTIVSYLLRVNITIAGEPIKQQFHLSSVQLGWVFSAFLFSYTIFMTPAGAWADRLGPRRVLTIAGLSWAILTLLIAYLPGTIFSSVAGVLAMLIGLRLLLGICEAPTFTAATKTISNWMPISERATANSLVIAGSLFGSATAAPLISWVMVQFHWRAAMAATSITAPILVAFWWRYARDRPQDHRDMGAGELELLRRTGIDKDRPRPLPGGWKLLLSSGQAWRLSIAYGCECYLTYLFIWWCYIYLVEVRKFSLIGGGFATAAPFILGTFSTPAAGIMSDRLVVRLGRRRGRQIVPMIALTGAAILAYAGVRAPSAWLAVLLLSLGAALAWMNEGPIWAAMTELAAPIAGAAGGFLNTGGNFGGALAALLTPWIAKELGWNIAFGAASLCAIAGAILWIGFDPSRQVMAPAEDAAPASQPSGPAR
ncbi:MAG TPA: MFS transporter [Terriglobia bacterium]|nr:MFS transporter [Terriglobia bacterium]